VTSEDLPPTEPADADTDTTPTGGTTHDAEVPEALRAFMATGWAPPDDAGLSAAQPVAPYAAKRRGALSSAFPGEMLVVPTGGLATRANDTDFPFRAGSDYAWLVGDTEPDAVLVLATDGAAGHTATVYVPARVGREDSFTDRRYGELWVGPRRGVAEVGTAYDVATAPLGELAEALDVATPIRVLRGLDPRVDALVGPRPKADAELATTLSELRLVKDDLEVAELCAAVDATVTGFAACVRELATARTLPNGERWLEGSFWRHSRVHGNDVGYGSIVACGAHATTLHWTRDDGPVRDGDLVLLDMGVEAPSLYTADITRTLPVSGRFSAEQRQVYDAVARAQRAGIEAVRAGEEFLAPHRAAMRVLTEALLEWGLLEGDVETLLTDQLHRRFTLHGTSHHLGLDVHDCAHARRERYREGTLAAGMVITVEPGLYFQPDDELVPERLRGIGVRIEDDVLVTADGPRVLSAALPTAAEDVEAWMAGVLTSPAGGPPPRR